MLSASQVPPTCTCTALALYHALSAERKRAAEESGESELWDSKGKEDGIENWQILCAGCMLVAVKVNEFPRKVRDIVNVMHQRSKVAGMSLEVSMTSFGVHTSNIAECCLCRLGQHFGECETGLSKANTGCSNPRVFL
jgi:hypothetical protein